MNEKLEKMYSIEGFLLGFHPDFTDNKTENDVIKEYANNPNLDKNDIIETLQEGQEILAMEPFPWKWVCDVIGYQKYDVEKEIIITDPAIYKTWVTEILSLLETEARRQGKL